jgi:arginyl-tRNA synthetase
LIESGTPAAGAAGSLNNVTSRQGGNKIDFKRTALTELMATIEADLKGFRVSFDTWFSESKIASDKDAAAGNKTKVELMCESLLATGFAFEQEGALWFQSTKYGDDKDRVLRRSDGRYTYLASDIAYHKNKIERGFTRLINLWGADHHGYVPRMKAAIQALGRSPETLHIILYQLVSLVRNGAPVAMSTRTGEFVTLEEVIKEVGVDACRFFFMLRAPDSQLEFDLELAKKQSSENPVFYVQYVHARCCSIFKEYYSKNPDSELKAPDFILLKTPEERDLAKKLAFFPDTLELCAKTYSPHHLTNYLMECSDLFHKFYEKCRVISADKELTNTRLSLVQCIASVIKNGLGLLGVSAPERM